jgi:hypothetical protein
MATLKGVGAIFGTATTATAGVVIAATDSRTGSDFTWDGVVDELEDSSGETKGCAVRNTTKEITLTIIPASTTIALARTEAIALLKTPGTAVTITSTDGATAITPVAGAYMLLRSRFRETNSGFAVVECDVKQWSGITDYTTIAT